MYFSKTLSSILLLLLSCSQLQLAGSTRKDRVRTVLKKLKLKPEKIHQSVLINLEVALDNPMALLDFPGPEFIIAPLNTDPHTPPNVYRAFFFSRFNFYDKKEMQRFLSRLYKHVNQRRQRYPFARIQNPKPNALSLQKIPELAYVQETFLNYTHGVDRRISSDDGSLLKRYGQENFVKDGLHTIHNSLRAAIFIPDYYIACLTDDETWFEQNTRNPLLYSKTFCTSDLKILKESIKQRYPTMRTWMTTALYPDIGNESFRLSKNQYLQQPGRPAHRRSSERARSKWAHSHYQQNKYRIQHTLPNLAKLPLVTMEEVKRAEQIFDKNQFAKRQLKENGEIPKELIGDDEVVCTEGSLLVVNFGCYEDQYKQLLFGNKEKEIPGLPILGFVSSDDPGDEELVAALEAIRENTREILENFQDQYFVTDPQIEEKYTLRNRNLFLKDNLDIFEFSGFLIPMVNSSESYATIMEEGIAAWKKRERTQAWIQMGGIVAWSIGCYSLLRSPLAKSLCEIPVGLGVNAYFFIIDNKRYQEALNIAFYRPDTDRPSYQDISNLNGLEFNKLLSGLMLPFFTGIFRVIKAMP